MADYDVILVGGGLSAGLVAERLCSATPGRRVAIIEAQPHIGGNHTWSFHASDVTEEQDAWLRPFCRAVWDEQVVRFPGYTRRLSTGYRTISSETFRAQLERVDSLDIFTDRSVTHADATGVVCSDGSTFSAPCTIDCRGAEPIDGLAVGYQKFVGLEVRLAKPHGLTAPVIMDARVTQIDGYRFIYLLPFSETELLIEDTYYADRPRLERDLIIRRIEAYAEDAGWKIVETIRTEVGVLPIVLDGPLDAVWPQQPASGTADLVRAGMRAGLFHQTTGYSLPLSAEVADALAAEKSLDTGTALRVVRDISERVWREQAYFRLLNRTMFLAPEPLQRRKIFERFYKLGQPLIERFFAGRLLTRDKLRLLTGRPPVPMFKAFYAFAPSSARGRLTYATGRPVEPLRVTSATGARPRLEAKPRGSDPTTA